MPDAFGCDTPPAAAGPVTAGWYRPSSFEVAAGWVHGVERTAFATGRDDTHPAEVLRELLREALTAGPCVVPFSGGRDSSLVLAVACDVARDAGVPLPLALTLAYPGDPQADETSWQRLVLDGLAAGGLRPAWEKVSISDELDVVGPLVTPYLAAARHPLWPPSIGATVAVARRASGATLLSGDHGDEVLGLRRATLLSGVARRRGRGLTSHDLRAIAGAAMPRLAVAGTTALVRSAPAWLNGSGRRTWRRRAAADALADPLRWDSSVRRSTATRAAVLGMHVLRDVVAEAGSRLVAPLGHAHLLASLATYGGPLGLENRGAGVRLLAGGLLPDELVGRRTKAAFNASRFSEHTRAVLRGPRLLGAAGEWVDGAALDRAWSSDPPVAGTAALVQQVWLAQQGLVA